MSSHLIIPAGVTLTIEPGVRVDVKEFQIQVQGTVIARGTSQNKIVFTTTGDRNSWLYYPHGLPHLFSFYRNASLEEQNHTHSMIENAIITEPIDVFAQITITNSSLQGAVILENQSSVLSENEISDVHVLEGAPTITNNNITDMLIAGGTPTIANNTINGGVLVWGGSPMVTNNTINGRTSVGCSLAPYEIVGSPVFSGNKFFDGIDAFGTGFGYTYNSITKTVTDIYGGELSDVKLTITNNDFNLANNKTVIYVSGMYVNISNNRITGSDNSPPFWNDPFNATMKRLVPGQRGIAAGEYFTNSNVSITENYINNCSTGISVLPGIVNISKNLISNNYCGIRIENSFLKSINPLPNEPKPNIATIANIQENTISNNTVGILCYNYSSPPNMTNNDIYDNTEYNFRLDCSNDTSVADNWWGTTNATAISQSIYDSKNDPTLGTVTFTPFSTAPQGQSDSSLEVPLPSQTPLIIVVAVGVSCIIVAAITIRRKHKKHVGSGE